METRNNLKERLTRGEILFGATTQIPSPVLVEILGWAGFDFTMIDTEHGQFDIETAGELIRAAHGAGVAPLVRMLKNETETILKVLDMGAAGIIAPHVSTPEDAARAVAACRYGAEGRRGACPLVRANSYGQGDWRSYQENANRNTLAIVLVEDFLGARNIDEILAVEGVDAVFMGPFDMSVSEGYFGNPRHPKVLEVVDGVLAACREKGVPAMYALSNLGDPDALVKKGVRLVLQSADAAVFARVCRDFIQSVSHLRGDKPGGKQ